MVKEHTPSSHHALDNSMSAFAKKDGYTVLDQAGLEVVTPSEAPEVVGEEDLPEAGIPRRSSLLKPEVTAHYADNEKIFRRTGDDDAPEHDEAAERLHVFPDENATRTEGYERYQKRYCCGLSRRALICLVAGIIVVVIVVAVLGGVLGTFLNKKKASTITPPLQTEPHTGLAAVLTASDSGRLLTYYQDPQGRIIENSYHSDTWTLSDRTNINMSVVTTAATPGSPLAAISYPYNGKNYRQVFFVNPTGAIMTTNSTQTLPGTDISTSWSVARAITTDTVAPNSVGLAACWSEDAMNGIRVYYPSQYGWMIELKYTFGQDGWVEGQNFDGSDAGTGVACAAATSGKDQYMNVYMRFVASGLVKQVWIDYTAKNGSTWSYGSGPQSWANQTIVAGSDIAVSSDDSQTEYVYYQIEDGVVARGTVNPSLDHYDTFDNFSLNAAVGTKLTAAFVDGGAMLMYQNSSSDSTIMLDNVSRYGVEIAKGVVP